MKYLLCTALSVFGFQLWAQSLEPGLWKSKTSVKLNGLPLPPSSNEECISSSQAKDAKAAIEKELKKQGCSLSNWVVKNQQLNAIVSCKNDDIEAVGKLHGEFSRKQYELRGEAKGKYKKVLPAVAALKLSGQWLKRCSRP